MEEDVGKKKRKKKPVDIIKTPEVPFFYYKAPPKCICLGHGHCWRICKYGKKSPKRDIAEDRPQGRRRRRILTWHPEDDKKKEK